MRGIILVRTACRRYAVRRDDLAAIRLLEEIEALPEHDSGRPGVCVDLGSLLDQTDQGLLRRPQALLVPLRRRTIALLVQRVEDFLEGPQVQLFPPILRERLGHGWAIGALVIDDDLVVVLDLRAVARTVLLQQRVAPLEQTAL